MYTIKLEQRYMGEQIEIEEMNQTQQPLWLVNNILFCYEGEKHTRNESEKNSTSYNTKENTVVARMPTQMDQRAQEGK